MNAALYDVKNKLSEYVKIAEEGEPVEITKHGQPSVIMVRIQDYSPVNTIPPSRFMQVHKKWLNSRRTKENFEDVWDYLERERKIIDSEKPNPWLYSNTNGDNIIGDAK